jgi:hypothetical protein
MMIDLQRVCSLSLSAIGPTRRLALTMLIVATVSIVTLSPASAQQTYSAGVATHYVHLPDGGEDGRALGIAVGAFSASVSNPCSLDAGQPFLEAMIITVYNSSGIDGGQYLFGTLPDGGVKAALSFVGDGGYLSIPQLATAGVLTLHPVVAGVLTGSYSATLTTGGMPRVDAGTASGTFSVQVCP